MGRSAHLHRAPTELARPRVPDQALRLGLPQVPQLEVF